MTILKFKTKYPEVYKFIQWKEKYRDPIYSLSVPKYIICFLANNMLTERCMRDEYYKWSTKDGNLLSNIEQFLAHIKTKNMIVEMSQSKNTTPTMSSGQVLYHYGPYMALDHYIVESIAKGIVTAIKADKDEPKRIKIESWSIKPLAQKRGIGFYIPETIPNKTDFDVSVWSHRANEFEVKKEQIEAEKKSKEIATQEYLLSQYPFMKDIRIHNSSTKFNMSEFIKHKFPGVKFTIKVERYNSYIVSIKTENDVLLEQIKTEVSIFNGYGLDETGDFWDPKPTAFNKVFGNVKFLEIQKK